MHFPLPSLPDGAFHCNAPPLYRAAVLHALRSALLNLCVHRQATNGADPKRRVHLLGFCRSVDSLSEVVEDAVLRRGGSVMLHNIETRR